MKFSKLPGSLFDGLIAGTIDGNLEISQVFQTCNLRLVGAGCLHPGSLAEQCFQPRRFLAATGTNQSLCLIQESGRTIPVAELPAIEGCPVNQGVAPPR